MNTEVWPFLISRNKVFDYRMVVAPNFVVENKIASLLIQATEGNVTEPGYIMYREIHGSKAGDITLLFCIMRAQNHHIGLEGSEDLKDRFGRAIDLIEGLVIRGQVPEIMITSGALQYAHEQMRPDYQAFWEDTNRTPSVRFSKSFEVTIDDRQVDRLKMRVLEPLYIEIESPEPPVEAKQPAQTTPSRQSINSHNVEETAEKWIDEGKRLKKAQRYDEALMAYEKAIRLDSHLVGGYLGKGDVFYYRKRYDEALAAFKEAIKRDPNSALAYNGKGNSFYMLKRYKEALAAYEGAIERDPNLILARNNKGTALFALERYQEALMAFEEAIERDPNSAALYFNKGDALREIGKHQEAFAAYNEALILQEKAIQLTPNEAKLFHFKSKILESLGRRQEAEMAEYNARQLEKRYF